MSRAFWYLQGMQEKGGTASFIFLETPVVISVLYYRKNCSLGSSELHALCFIVFLVAIEGGSTWTQPESVSLLMKLLLLLMLIKVEVGFVLALDDVRL